MVRAAFWRALDCLDASAVVSGFLDVGVLFAERGIGIGAQRLCSRDVEVVVWAKSISQRSTVSLPGKLFARRSRDFDIVESMPKASDKSVPLIEFETLSDQNKEAIYDLRKLKVSVSDIALYLQLPRPLIKEQLVQDALALEADASSLVGAENQS